MAHTESSRLNRVYSMFIPPDVFLGKRVMTEFDTLHSKLRHCHTCGRPMIWSEFLAGARIGVGFYTFGMKMLKEIWENDIFVLKCCRCFHSNTQNSDVLDAITHWLPEYMRNPAVTMDDLNNELESD